MLDFGCGDGALVCALQDAGADAYGCDFTEELGDDPRLNAIEEPYRLPYPDGSFDVIVSAEVFEHVQDCDSGLLEIRRVLRPGGVSAHRFPPRWTPLEPHCKVPLATTTFVVSAVVGRHWGSQPHQAGMGAAEIVAVNQRFLREHTTYYSRRKLLQVVRRVFPDARLLTLEPLAASPSARGRRLSALARRMPWLAVAWSETRSRTLILC